MAGLISQKIAKALGSKIIKSRALPGGDIADVSLLTLDDGTHVVAKRPRMDQPDTTAVEALMLKHLAKKSTLPVPTVLHQSKALLVLEYIPHMGSNNKDSVTENVASHVAALHQVRPKGNRPYYGFEKDTFIGPLPQVNTPSHNWCEFFTEHRLLAMAQSCINTGRFGSETMDRIEALASKLPDMLPKHPESSLLHGDLWSGNMLLDGDKAAGFIDPAVSYGHKEMDIAFMLLMGGLQPTFQNAYEALYPFEPGFNEERKYIYQLWPFLVHMRLFGGGYLTSIEQILKRIGC